MKRVAATLAALGLVLVGCASAPAPSLPPGAVYLLTWSLAPSETRGCYTLPHQGPTSVDPTYGTAFHGSGAPNGVPIAWPPGYTGRQAGAEVEVLDPTGKVRAVTGQGLEVYIIDQWTHVTLSEPAPASAFLACG